MDYRDWARGDDTPVTSPRSRSPRSEDRPRRTGARRGVKPPAAEPNPDAISQWDPLGATGGELAAIQQIEDTASFKLPKNFWQDEPDDDRDQVIVPTGGDRRVRRDDDDEPPARGRRTRGEIELSSGARRRDDVGDSRAERWDEPDDIELTSGGRRRRDFEDSDEIELSSGARRRRDDVADSRVRRTRGEPDEIELSSGARRRRDDISDSRAGRDWDEPGDIELSSGARRQRDDISDSRAGRSWSDGSGDIELSSGGRRRRDGVADSRAGRGYDDSDEIELSSGGRRQRDDVTDSRARRAWSDGSADESTRGAATGPVDGRRGRRDDSAGAEASGAIEVPVRGRRGRRAESAETEPVSRGRRHLDDVDPDAPRGRRGWQDEATDTELPSIGYAATGTAEVPTRGGRSRRDAAADTGAISRGRRRRQDEADAGVSRSWQTEETDTELPGITRREDTGTIQVPLRGRRDSYADTEPVDEPSRTWHGEPADPPISRGRQARRGDTDVPERGRPGWSDEPIEAELPGTTRARRGREDEIDPPSRGRRTRRDDPDALDSTDVGRRTRRGGPDALDSTDVGRRTYGDEPDAFDPTGAGRRSRRDAPDSTGVGRRSRRDEPDAPGSTSGGRRSRRDESDAVGSTGVGRRGRHDEVAPGEQTGHGRTWSDGRSRHAETEPPRRGRSDEIDPAARGWRDGAAGGDVPAQRRRLPGDGPDLPGLGRRAEPDDPDLGDPPVRGRGGRRAEPGPGERPGRGADRGSWAGEPDSDRWRHPDMTGEWSRRAMAPIDQPPEPRDDRPGQDAGRRGRWEAARDATDGVTDTGSRRIDDPRGRRDPGQQRPGDRRDDEPGTGSWERMTDTGQYDPTTTTGEWDRLVGSIDEEAEEKFEAFWSGHRLSGDDPRWVPTPSTAPRSPAVGLPEPRRPEPEGYDDGPRRGRSAAEEAALARAAMPPALDATDPGWGAPARTAPRGEPAPARSAPPARTQAPPQRRSRWQQEEFEQLDNADNGGFLAAVLYAVAWYAVPVLAFGLWLMTLPAVATDDCVSDVTGGGCDSPRAQALAGLLSGVPTFGIALGVTLIAAILLRWLGHSWRAGSVGLAAAVVGGGLAAVLNSVFTGQPLG